MNDNSNIATELLDRILLTAKTALPETIGKDVKDNVRAAIQDVISELDIVSREELDIQKQVLQKTRTKIDEMEKVISELEKKLGIAD